MKKLDKIRSPKIRTGQPSTKLSKEEFLARYQRNFIDPNFLKASDAVEQISEIAWENYQQGRKAPHTRPAGRGFADPKYKLSDEWREASEKLKQAEKKQKSKTGKPRILLINASPRNEYTCPGEVSKSFRLSEIVEKHLEKRGAEVDFLDLSRMTAEYGKNIYPCKSCVSTAMPLCHWPCSCYPNHSQGHANDWIFEILEQWVLAHGVMIITPVHWYQAPSALKLMMDRMVCADGGNPDPTSTGGKDPKLAKRIELAGWDYPKHLKGRFFSLVTHGDYAGAETLRRNLWDWLTDMELLPASYSGIVDGYIGYQESYAHSHDDLDKDKNFQALTLNAAEALIQAVKLNRAGKWPARDIEAKLKDPNPK